jgi:hypothetical protein
MKRKTYLRLDLTLYLKDDQLPPITPQNVGIRKSAGDFHLSDPESSDGNILNIIAVIHLIQFPTNYL